MTTNEQTMTDIGTNTAQRTGRHSSRPEEVLFFAPAHFLFFNFMPTHIAHICLCLLTHKPTQKQSQKSAISQRTEHNPLSAKI